MWKQTVRRLVVESPRRRSPPLWWAGGLLLLLIPAGFLGLGDGSGAMTQGARIVSFLLGAGLLVLTGWTLLARRHRGP